MLTKRLNGVEQLERKDLYAGLVDDPGLSPGPTGDEQTSFAGTVMTECLLGDLPAGPGAGFTTTILDHF